MLEVDSFLDGIKLFQVSKEEFHLFLGDKERPRASMVIIRGSRITEPIRVPPTSIEALENRYTNKELQLDSLDARIRMILSLLKLDNFAKELMMTKNDKIIQWKDFERTNGQDFIPITDQIIDWLTTSPDQTTVLFDFISLLSEPDRSKRQELLGSILKSGINGYCFVYYIFWIREEITISCIRELGRQMIKIDFVLESCTQLISSGVKSFEKFSRAYIDQFDPEHNSLEKLLRDEELERQAFLSKSLDNRVHVVLKGLKQIDQETLQTFSIIRILSKHERYSFEVKNILMSLNLNKIDKKSMRIALMTLLQYAETAASPKLLATVAAIAGLFDQISFNESIHIISELEGVFHHIANRILSMLYLWKSMRKRTVLYHFFVYYLSFIPKPKVTTKLPNHAEIGQQWLKKSYIFSKLSDYVEKVLNDPEWLKEICFHQSTLKHPMLQVILNEKLKKQDITVEKLSYKILLSHNYARQKNLIETIEEGILLQDEFFFEVYPDLVVLPAIIASKSILPASIFKYFLLKILASADESGLDLVKSYLRTVGSINREKLRECFEISKTIILEKYNYENLNIFLKHFILTIIVNWGKVTGTFLEDDMQTTVDTFKIIYQDEVDEFDLESSRPLAIETIAECYKLTNGSIPRFIESNIQFSFTKPVWDQLARHYLALGIQRPTREAIAASKLKEVPNYLLRDVLGQIALVNQTLNFCERNGFREPLENLIISNMYRRGWNVERGMERTIPSYFGSFSPRLRSYFSSYLVIEQGEIALDVLLWARDVEEFILRDRIIRELERYGTPDMWIVLAEAFHEDVQKRSIQQLKESRMSATDRSKIIVKLLQSHNRMVNQLGLDWLQQYGVQQDEFASLCYNENPDVFKDVLDYLITNASHLTEQHDELIFQLVRKYIWKSNTSGNILEKLAELSSHIGDENYRSILKADLLTKMQSVTASQLNVTLSQLSYLE